MRTYCLKIQQMATMVEDKWRHVASRASPNTEGPRYLSISQANLMTDFLTDVRQHVDVALNRGLDPSTSTTTIPRPISVHGNRTHIDVLERRDGSYHHARTPIQPVSNPVYHRQPFICGPYPLLSSRPERGMYSCSQSGAKYRIRHSRPHRTNEGNSKMLGQTTLKSLSSKNPNL